MDTHTLARIVATVAHGAIGQKRKYTNRPYIEHPAAVASTVWTSTKYNKIATAAAWLHDVVEDTHLTWTNLVRLFPVSVVELVEMVTDISKPEDGNRATRKAMDREHLAKASPLAKTIKLADVIDNAGSIIQCDPDFARVYMAEKKLLLEVLKEGDSRLYKVCENILFAYYTNEIMLGTGPNRGYK